MLREKLKKNNIYNQSLDKKKKKKKIRRCIQVECPVGGVREGEYISHKIGGWVDAGGVPDSVSSCRVPNNSKNIIIQ